MKIKIYQINMGRDERRVAFMGSDEFPRFTGSEEIDSSIYDCVFEGEVDCHTLEDAYRKFNLDHPEDYRGRSMSMSDIVEIIDSETTEKGFYYCDTVGFKKVDFEPEKAQPMKPKETITVILCEPGKFARKAEIGTTLADLQGAVGGDIQAIYPYSEEVAVVCDDEGKISGKALNRAIYDDSGEIIDIIAGTFFICDCSGENFGSLSREQLNRYGTQFHYPEKFIKINDQIKALKYKPETSRDER